LTAAIASKLVLSTSASLNISGSLSFSIEPEKTKKVYFKEDMVDGLERARKLYSARV
jgi:hypothetical protein